MCSSCGDELLPGNLSRLTTGNGKKLVNSKLMHCFSSDLSEPFSQRVHKFPDLLILEASCIPWTLGPLRIQDVTMSINLLSRKWWAGGTTVQIDLPVVDRGCREIFLHSHSCILVQILADVGRNWMSCKIEAGS